ncbi:MAG: heme ABC exporter ATP-binding protein CcmA [Wenzhouxiangella sp.]|nr:MAG: heme ABC exporter ATP-binding protein CcmA [Wenzhouxiangella sp.]
MSMLLQARAVSFRRQGDRIFTPLDVDLVAGQAIVVLGPNGCGKTTLLRLLAGILEPAEGQVQRHAATAFLGHASALKGELNCRENLEFLRRFHGCPGISSSRALARTGLTGLGLRPARALSAGQKRRLGLAGLLVAPRPIWLLDEPYASLDDAGGQLVDELLNEHLDNGGSVALSTHQRKPLLTRAARELQVQRAEQEEPA